MSASVKASCPGCRNLIRIPLDWSERPLKCKKCGTLVQMRKREAATAVAMPAPTATVPVFEPPPVPVQYAPQPYNYPLPQHPGYGYSQHPGYGYPPQPAYAPPPPPEPTVFPTHEDLGPARPTYRRTHNRSAHKVIVVVIGAIVLAACIAVGMKIQQGFQDANAQTKHEDPPVDDKGKPKDAANPNVRPGTPAPPISTDPFPRRLLFIHVCKYVYFNNLSPGVFGRGEDLPTRAAQQMAFDFRVPTEANNNQLFALIDTVKGTPPPLKQVLTQTFDQFFATSREQDRIAIYFGGHAREIDGKAYLVPVDGDPDDAATLIPLDDVYAKLAACKAQQKVLLFDVCRFNPGVGAARAGSEPMSEKLAERLHAAPPGVQVITSCSAGQNAQETTESGSEFLAAFRVKGKELKAGGALAGAQPAQPIPTEKWTDVLREFLAARREYAPSQTVKGTVPLQEVGAMVPYAKEAPAATRFPWPTVPPGASPGEVQKLLQFLELPGIRKEIELPPGLALVYPFSAEVMKTYTPDVPDDESVKGDKHPLRKATYDALNYIREHWQFGTGEGLRESLNGAADETLKKEIAKDQIPIAKLTLELEEHLNILEIAGKKLADEKSRRWQALYAYALAQIQMRWAFVQEYNLALGNIKTDNLEKPPGGGTPVYRLVSVEKMKSKKDITEKVEAAREAFEKLVKEHKGSPFEVLAKMNRNVALGLTWKLEVQQAAGEDKKEN